MTSISKDITESLSWLNSDSLQLLLNEHRNDSLEIEKYQVVPATAKGENYLSDLFRVTAVVNQNHGDLQNISLILKCKPKGDFREDYINTAKFFTKELEMLSITLPEMSLMFKQLKCNLKLIPEFVHYVKDSNVFVLEDLLDSGFRLGKRNGLDLEHCIIVMKSLGIFHAVSAIINEQKPELLNPYRQQVFCDETHGYMSAYLLSTIRSLESEVEKWPECNEKYGEKLKNVAEDSWKLIIDSVTRDESSFNVLNHGDLWLNNIMFHYSEGGQVDDISFVDFQMCCFSSPAVDLHYFMFSSPQSQVRELHYDTLIAEYHKSLCNSLTSLGYTKNVPTIDQLKEDLRKRMFYGFFAASSALPNILAAPEEKFNLESSLEGGENPTSSNINMYKNEAYRKEIQRLLPIFENCGIL